MRGNCLPLRGIKQSRMNTIKRSVYVCAAAFGLATAASSAQSTRTLTLKEAEAIALSNHPRIRAAQLQATAARQVTTEVRSAYFPNLYDSMTGVGAQTNSRITAGGLNNPTILSRYGDGLTVSQLVTDLGRTARLEDSVRLRAQAQDADEKTTEAEVILEVDQPYYAALQAQSVLKVAEQTVEERQLVVDQVTALANSKLKSALDVSFANVNLEQAKLLLVKAQNDVEAAFAELSTAMGYRTQQQFQLVEQPLPPAPPADANALVAKALRDRPDVKSLGLNRDASVMFARAEKDLSLPTISTVATAGYTPVRDSTLRDRYSAVGINVNIPIFNGHLFSARRAEADLKAQAASENVRDLENRIARDVRIAWLNANTAYQRLDLTARLREQAQQALELAQARYNLGLSSIVELGQAQLNSTEAEIAQSSAKYEYMIQRAILNYQTGGLP